MTDYDYGYQPLLGLPEKMDPWGMWLELATPTQFGQYVLVKVEQASLELHHEVVVRDENDQPLPDVCVIFGFDTGNERGARPRGSYWPQAPRDPVGNVEYTDSAGYARHTFQEGGENIFIWDVEADGVLRLASDIVLNCNGVNEKYGKFRHTGVKLTFQRRRAGVVPERQRQAEAEHRQEQLEARLAQCELQLLERSQALAELEARVAKLEAIIKY